MGAQPKNKITRAERGKRRLGNTPKLRRQQPVSKAPLHKRGFAMQLLQQLGLTSHTNK